MEKIEDTRVAAVFASYPKPIRGKLLHLRALIFAAAAETDGVGALEETLKWGQPSYLAKGGSTVRLGWKDGTPAHSALYFTCNSKLVDTFKALYGDTLTFEGNRAIVFGAEDALPADELKHCITLALTYHKRKHLPLLGA